MKQIDVDLETEIIIKAIKQTEDELKRIFCEKNKNYSRILNERTVSAKVYFYIRKMAECRKDAFDISNIVFEHSFIKGKAKKTIAGFKDKNPLPHYHCTLNFVKNGEYDLAILDESCKLKHLIEIKNLSFSQIKPISNKTKLHRAVEDYYELVKYKTLLKEIYSEECKGYCLQYVLTDWKRSPPKQQAISDVKKFIGEVHELFSNEDMNYYSMIFDAELKSNGFEDFRFQNKKN